MYYIKRKVFIDLNGKEIPINIEKLEEEKENTIFKDDSLENYIKYLNKKREERIIKYLNGKKILADIYNIHI